MAPHIRITPAARWYVQCVPRSQLNLIVGRRRERIKVVVFTCGQSLSLRRRGWQSRCRRGHPSVGLRTTDMW